MTTRSITVELDLNMLSSYTDEYLAALWHVAQLNPAPHGDYWAGEIVSQLGFEIIRRWLAQVPPELYRHQPTHNLRQALSGFATYEPPADVAPGSPGVSDPHWYEGAWVPKATADRD